MLLLCIAIILVLGILLYEYVPMAKTIPNKVEYTIPQEAKEELAKDESVDESQIIMTYEINSSDLNNYKRIQDYKPGKANPFSSYATEKVENADNKNTNTQNSTSTNISQNTTSNTNSSGGHYFQDTGTK